MIPQVFSCSRPNFDVFSIKCGPLLAGGFIILLELNWEWSLLAPVSYISEFFKSHSTVLVCFTTTGWPNHAAVQYSEVPYTVLMRLFTVPCSCHHQWCFFSVLPRVDAHTISISRLVVQIADLNRMISVYFGSVFIRNNYLWRAQ
jgi:hypothetical protein